MELSQKKELVETEEKVGGEAYLLGKASEQGFVTYDDILVAFPQAEENLVELEEILASLMEDGVQIGSPE